MKHVLNTALCIVAILILLVLASYGQLPLWTLALPVILWFAVAGLGSAFIFTNYHIPVLCKADIRSKQVAITFDDGPAPETEKVLDLLKSYGGKATFFCIGSKIDKNPEICKRIFSEGHTIGNHSFSHATRFGFFTKNKVQDEIERTDLAIKKNISKKVLLFRPPFGVTSPSIAKAVKTTGHTVIGWNIRSLDTMIKSEQKILLRIQKRLSPGSIILLHDTSERTIRVLEQLLILLQNNGYKAVTVDQLLNIPAYEK